jgi:hypothetical protein
VLYAEEFKAAWISHQFRRWDRSVGFQLGFNPALARLQSCPDTGRLSTLTEHYFSCSVIYSELVHLACEYHE